MLTQSCDVLPGVGPALSAKLARCGINTLQDLLLHLPFRYQDRTRVTAICDLRAQDFCVVVGRVCKTEITRGKRPILNCFIEDKTGILKLRFFHFHKQQMAQFNASNLVRVFGEVRRTSDTWEMTHPDYQCINDESNCRVEETLTPIYATTEGLSQTRLRQLVGAAITHCSNELHQLEWMSHDELDAYNFISFTKAITELHTPPPDISITMLESGTHPALKRLAFDELLAHRVSMQLARAERDTQNAPVMPKNDEVVQKFLQYLPFTLTKAQNRVYHEISQALSLKKPMLRLVQGDVGSGKTVICALAAIQAIINGYQVAIMAPTDILSEQHEHTLTPWIHNLGFALKRLSGKMQPALRKEALTALANNQCNIIVGTHALFQEQVNFARLGLVIIDEQHRFGVEQRLLLQQKGAAENYIPHQLLLTATPIPRTLAMTQYAHLDLSIIDERPPGRTPVTTAVINQNMREQIIHRLQNVMASGSQAYWVCTLIDESEKLQCMNATTTAANLQQQLPNIKIGLIHGRLKALEKEQIMADFKNKKIDLLVATTVIEVGVDVPNASLMIIENAERLGLSQLHQLRGRVGRGSTASHCILLYQPPISKISAERLKIMRATDDGFIIAEQDLILRGSGEFLGTRQAGYRRYKIAHIERDKTLFARVITTANTLLEDKPTLANNIAKCWLGDFEQFLKG